MGNAPCYFVSKFKNETNGFVTCSEKLKLKKEKEKELSSFFLVHSSEETNKKQASNSIFQTLPLLSPPPSKKNFNKQNRNKQ